MVWPPSDSLSVACTMFALVTKLVDILGLRQITVLTTLHFSPVGYYGTHGHSILRQPRIARLPVRLG